MFVTFTVLKTLSNSGGYFKVTKNLTGHTSHLIAGEKRVLKSRFILHTNTTFDAA